MRASAVHSEGKWPSQRASAAGRVQACGQGRGQSGSELPVNGRLCSGSGGGVLPHHPPPPAGRPGLDTGQRRSRTGEGPALPLRGWPMCLGMRRWHQDRSNLNTQIFSQLLEKEFGMILLYYKLHSPSSWSRNNFR